ncbi:MAG TPA: CRTAC1 family protein [Blastocatellia bacterium]|nr:CRTAC1 family protein [Blastocatellia bacterium]
MSTKITAAAKVYLIVAVILFGSWVGIGQERPAESLPQLTDISQSTGIKFSHVPSPDKKYIVESMSGGVALIDYDLDGRLDIYFTNAPTVEMALAGQKARGALYRNQGDGTFTDVTDKAGVGEAGWAMGACVGDYNNDGRPDLYVTAFGPNTLYRNNGDGTFTDVTKEAKVGDPRWSSGCAFGDYDGDGWVDLLVANYVDFRLGDLPKFGEGANCQYRGLAVQCGPKGLKGAGDALYHNNGDGTFTDVSKAAGVSDPNGYYGLGVVWTDLNEDGRPEAFVANDTTPNFLYRNDGQGRFTEIAFEAGVAVNEAGAAQAGMGIALGDYLHTGRTSLFVTNFSEEYNTLYRNDGKLLFTDVSYASNTAVSSLPYVGWGAGFFDLENDGWLDLLVVNGHVYPQVDTRDIGTKYRQPKQLYLNQRNGTFREAGRDTGSALSVPRVSRGTAFGDLDNDGDLDIVVGELDGGPMILRNDGGNRNNWITLELKGTLSNRLALGARVKVVTGKLAQVDEVRSGGSYLSQNDLRLHFGLGKAERVDRVEIRWPSGKTEVLTDLAARSFYTVKEGEGIISPVPRRQQNQGR